MDYKANNWCKIIAIVTLLFSTMIFLCTFICISPRLPEILIILDKKITFIDFPLFIVLIIVTIDYVIICTVLAIIIVKDDGGVKFVKINELKRIQNEFNNFNNSYEVIEETIKSKNNNKKLQIYNAQDTITKKENSRLELYKKYMDTIADI